MRTGPLLVAGGLLLLAAALFSTAVHKGSRWTPPQPQVQPLLANGWTDIDIGETWFFPIELDDGVQPTVMRLDWPADHYKHSGQSIAEQLVQETLTLRGEMRDEVRMTMAGPAQRHAAHEPTLRIPADRLRRLSGRWLNVQAHAPAGALALEGSVITWDGDAEHLQAKVVYVDVLPSAIGLNDDAPAFRYVNGRIAHLQVHASAGLVELAALDRVDRVTLVLGPKVELRLKRIEDLARIDLTVTRDADAVPEGAAPAVPDAAGQVPRASSEASHPAPGGE